MGSGIDYGFLPMANGKLPNRDEETGIRYGVIPVGSVDWWYEGSEAVYPEPEEGEELDEMVEPDCWQADEAARAEGVEAHTTDGTDIFVTKSPFFTRARFCSPCAPGACYLLNPDADGERAYCFGHDWFEGAAPYPVYRVDTGEEVPYVPES